MDIYLDNNATTRVLPVVATEMLTVMEREFGNASSAHSLGERARNLIRNARINTANLIGSLEPDHVLFTGSGSEANNLVLKSILQQSCKPHVITSSVEHSSVLKVLEQCSDSVNLTILDVNSEGIIDLQDLEKSFQSNTCLVSIQWVNNETGVIQPIQKIADLCSQHHIPFHTDAAQAVGKMVIDVESINVDFLTLAAHKIHGPQGVGAIYAREIKQLKPMIVGGSQEFGLRAGTENVAGIVGLGTAARIRHEGLHQIISDLTELRDEFEGLILEKIADVKINGSTSSRICNTSNLLFEGVDGQALIARLDQEHVYCSQSSACTNHRPEPSYVLRAMGLSEEEGYASVRFSFGVENTASEVEAAANAIAKHVAEIRAFKTKFGQSTIGVK